MITALVTRELGRAVNRKQDFFGWPRAQQNGAAREAKNQRRVDGRTSSRPVAAKRGSASTAVKRLEPEHGPRSRAASACQSAA
jgi:hypothetical protein